MTVPVKRTLSCSAVLDVVQVVLTFESVCLSLMIEMKASERYFPVVLFIFHHFEK